MTTMTQGSLSAVERGGWSDLIARQSGLALRDAQVPLLAELLRARMEARGVTASSAYFDLVEAEGTAGLEWHELIDRLVSHETSFFRHMPSFDVLRTRILPELRRRPHFGDNRLTLFSAGCSTGQEAYSLAMVALEDEAIAGQFTVWGADISRRAIDVARRGRYAERMVDGIPSVYRSRYLHAINVSAAREYEVSDELRRRVRFVAANLYPACGVFLSYDVIFCHNLLIYLTPAAVPHFVAALAARLNFGGYLLLGPGEAPVRCPAGLEVVNINGVRAFRRAGRVAHEGRP